MKIVPIKKNVIGRKQSQVNIKVGAILNTLAMKIVVLRILLNMMIFHHKMPDLCGELFLVKFGKEE